MKAMREAGPPLLERIRTREANVGIVGMGYVGLPLAMAFADAGFPVLGLDIDSRKTEKIEAGESYMNHIASEPMAKLTGSGRLKATTDFSRAAWPSAPRQCDSCSSRP